MFTSHPSTGLVSLTYNQYSCLVLAVSIVATASTIPTATQSNRIRLMNKVNTPTTGESGIYNINNETLTVTVNNSDAADKMTGVLFTSNLVSPDDNVVVPKPASAISNSFTFARTNINKQSFSLLSDTECKFRVAYNVIDNSGGSDITGLQGPDVNVALPSVPGKVNYAISNFGYKTMNDDVQSSFSFKATFNSDNNTSIAGLKLYFNTTADFSSSSSKVMVGDVKRSDGRSSLGLDTVQDVDVRLDNLPIFSSWANLSAGYVEFVPYFIPTTGGSDVNEIPSQQTRYGIYNVLPISSVTTATLEGGIVQAATTLKWTGEVGSSYNLVGPGGNLDYLAPAEKVRIYKGPNYTGAVTDLEEGDHGLGFGTLGGWNDVVASIFIPPGFTVKVWSGAINSYGSSSTTYTSSQPSVDSGISSIQVIGVANFSYVFLANTLNAATAVSLSLKRQQTLPQVAGTTSPLFITLNAKTWYGPVTNVSFIPVSIDTSSMALSVKRGSNNSQLLASHAETTISETSTLVVTAIELCKVVGLVSTALTFSSGTDSTALLQKPVITNTYTLSGEALGGLLDLKMRVKAGVKYDYTVGSAAKIVKDTSSATLPLGPSTQYRVAAVLTMTSTNKYTVNDNRIGVSVSINANGLAPEGLATVVAFISQESNYTDANDAQAGVGGTALAVFGPGSTRTYTVGANANIFSTIDNLAPGEEATTTPVNLSASVNEIEVGEYKLNVGNLRDTDVTVLSFPKAGFNTTQTIGVMLIVTNRLGHDILSTVLTYAPPLLLSRAANLTTIQYTGTAQAVVDAYSASTKPLFTLEDPRNTGTPEWFAVVNNSSKAKILEYAKSTGSAVSTYFTPPEQSSPVPFNNIVTTLMTDFSQLFIYPTSFNKNISDWDTSNVINMTYMFYGAVAFNQDISKWNTSKVTNMSFMFWDGENNSAFNQNIGSWNVSNVTDMRSMFRGAKKFNNGGNSSIGSWNTAKVINMSQLFFNASAFNQNIGSWNTGQVTNMNHMFYSQSNMTIQFNQNIGSWDVSNVTDMGSMFWGAGKFNNGGNSSIGSWNVSKVQDMSSMFKDCVIFNQNIGLWNTSTVKNMTYMFFNTPAFNQNISGWIVTDVTNFTSFKDFSGLNNTPNNIPPAFRI